MLYIKSGTTVGCGCWFGGGVGGKGFFFILCNRGLCKLK